MVRTLAIAALLVLTTACATTPDFDTEGVALEVTPEQAVSESRRLEGTRILWGGVIVAARNLEDTTRLEILGYPLDGRQRPVTDAEAQRRFLAVHEGYLETADYAQGRWVTLTGPLAGTRSGQVGEATYTYPVVRVKAIHLWSQREPTSEPRFHFGIGVLFGG